MSSSLDDTTQPIADQDIDHDVPIAAHHNVPAYGNVENNTGTLPSTAIAGTSDANKFSGNGGLEMAPVTSHAHATAFPFAHHVAALPEYHKPMMSQMESQMMEEERTFLENASEPAPVVESAPANHEEVHQEVVNEANTEERVGADSAETRIDHFFTSENSNPPAEPEVVASEAPAVVKAPKLDSESLEVEEEANVEEHAPQELNDSLEEGNEADVPEKLENEAALDEETSRALEDIKADMDRAYEEEAAEQKREQNLPQRSGRRPRRVTQSQGPAYTYEATGTLQADSEDEDGGWNSDDEHQTQKMITAYSQHGAPKLGFDSEEEDLQHTLDPMSASEGEEEEKESAPKLKKQKVVELDSEDKQDEAYEKQNNNMEIDEPKKLAKSAAADGAEVVEVEDEEIVISRPRPSLGNVGRPAPVTKPKSTSSKVATPKSPISSHSAATAGAKKAAGNAMHISDDEGDETANNGKTTSSKPSSSNTPSSKIRANADDDEEEQLLTQKSKTSTSSKPKSSNSATSLVSPSTSQKKSQKRNNNDEDDGEYEGEEEFVEEAPPRPKRSREQASKPSHSSSSTSNMRSPITRRGKGKAVEKLPSEEVARILRTTAKHSIATYLQEDEGDMEDYFTQHKKEMQKTDPAEIPSDLFRGLSFIVTGLRAGDATAATSSTFVKLQIKSLGGRLVNVRTANRQTATAIKNRRKSLLQEGGGEPKPLLPLCILISEKPQRTFKYINALVNGVPCVHYRWFLACLHFGKLLPLEEFLLPAGYNEDAALVTMPAWCVQEDLSEVDSDRLFPFTTLAAEDDPFISESIQRAIDNKPTGASAKGSYVPKKKKGFDNYRVQIIGIPAFQNQWKSILKQAGARIVDRLDAARDFGRIDFVLSDSEPTDLSIQLATSRGLPLCTIDWALQSIIQRKVQHPSSKPAYTLHLDEWN